MAIVTRKYAAEVVASALAAEACCPPGVFAKEGLHLSEVVRSRKTDPLPRRFPQREHSLAITTMGKGVVVSATHTWMPWVAELFQDVEHGDAFDLDLLSEAARRASSYSYRLHEPHLYSVTSSQDCRAHEIPSGYTTELGGSDLLESLDHTDWPNAISPNAPTQGRQVALTAIVFHSGDVVGVATATEDSDALWQIGIDVQPEHRGRGLGPVLTSQLARAVFGQGRVPYYGTTAANILSRRTARSSGFYPCWISSFTTEK